MHHLSLSLSLSLSLPPSLSHSHSPPLHTHMYTLTHTHTAQLPSPQELKAEKLTLKGVLETHFHADFVSGHYELGQRTNTTVYFGPGAAERTKFTIHELKDDEVCGDTCTYNIVSCLSLRLGLPEQALGWLPLIYCKLGLGLVAEDKPT